MKARLTFLALFFVSIVFAQTPEQIQRYRADDKGNSLNRRQGMMDGNRIATLYYNNGQVGKWQFKPSLEWPKGSGHQYLDGYAVMVAAQVTAPGNGQVIHPLETSYSEQMPKDPVTGLIWGMEPLAGYINPNSRMRTPAMSNDPSSYPSPWPAALGLGAEWNGQWYGYAGKGARDGVLETFFVVDDSKDGKYKRSPYLYYPIASDSDRGGLGLRMEVRGMQFSDSRLQDVLFWNYTVTNIADRDYDSTAFGIFMVPGVGGAMSGNDDASCSPPANLVYMWDHLGKGDPTMGTWRTGYAGIGILSSPKSVNGSNVGALSLNLLADNGPTGVWPKNNENMWRKMTGGFVDTAIVNSNISIVVATPLFKAQRGVSEKFDVAMIMGNDLPEIIMKNFLAQAIHDHDFIMPDSLASVGPVKVALQTPADGGTLSGTVNVTWSVEGAAGNVASFVYASKDNNNWVPIGVDSLNTHTLAWNTLLVPDGIFYTIRVITIADNGLGLTDSGSRLVVNNASASAKPEIRFSGLAPKTVLKGSTSLAWEGGDADGDSCFVNLSYKLASEKTWTVIASHIPASARAYLWDTRPASNSGANDYQIKAEIISNTDTSSVTAEGLSIQNTFVEKPGASLIVSQKTNATGAVNVLLVDSTAITGHQYLITFSYSTASGVTASVTDRTTGTQKLTGIGPLDGIHESKTFDGLRLRIASDALALDQARTGWLNATSAFPITVAPDSSFGGLNEVRPYDYQFTFSNAVVDTSEGNLDPDYPSIFLKFSVKNVTLNTQADVLVKDLDNSGTLTKGDNLKILEDLNGYLMIPWKCVYGSAQSNAPEPALGDVYMLVTKKPFAVGDSIVFTTAGLTGVDVVTSTIPADYELAQNFPNPFNPATTIRFSIPAAGVVDLKVYDMLGKEISTLVHERMQPGTYSVRLDGSRMASGMYFYRLTAGKSAITKKLLLVK